MKWWLNGPGLQPQNNSYNSYEEKQINNKHKIKKSLC